MLITCPRCRTGFRAALREVKCPQCATLIDVWAALGDQDVLELPRPEPARENAAEPAPVLDPSFEPALGAFFNPPSAPASVSNFWRRLAGALAVAALIAIAAYFILTNLSSLRRGGPSATDLVAKAAAQTPTPAASQAAEQKEPASNPAPNAGAMTSARSVDPAAAPFTLQVGAHATEAKARQVAASLTEAGLEASVELPGRSTWYRVHVGAFAGRAEAERYGAQLRREGKIQEFLVTDRRQP